ncbi:hypothetical protein ABIB42_001236 [Massilia sp. UYP32]|jgi:hypothetical protein|nr:hypothetical protein [Massilia timonae]
MSSRTALSTHAIFTTMLRLTCRNRSGSSCGSKSFSGTRISASLSAVATFTYLSTAWKNTMSATGIIRTTLPTAARTVVKRSIDAAAGSSAWSWPSSWPSESVPPHARCLLPARLNQRAQALHRLAQSARADRLEHVVHCGPLESLDRIVNEGASARQAVLRRTGESTVRSGYGGGRNRFAAALRSGN